MNNRVAWHPVLLLDMAFVGSGTFKAELLTNFEVSPDEVKPDKLNTISINNTGFVQADNAVMSIVAGNSTITKFSDACAEGQISRMDNKTLVAEFPRMSPKMPREFELYVSNPSGLDIAISSDGRLESWDGSQSILLWPLALGMLLLVLAIELAALAALLKNLLRSNWRNAELHFSRTVLRQKT